MSTWVKSSQSLSNHGLDSPRWGEIALALRLSFEKIDDLSQSPRESSLPESSTALALNFTDFLRLRVSKRSLPASNLLSHTLASKPKPE
jgi:hypothetical protein